MRSRRVKRPWHPDNPSLAPVCDAQGPETLEPFITLKVITPQLPASSQEFSIRKSTQLFLLIEDYAQRYGIDRTRAAIYLRLVHRDPYTMLSPYDTPGTPGRRPSLEDGASLYAIVREMSHDTAEKAVQTDV